MLTLARAYLDHTTLATAAATHLRSLADATGATALLGVVNAERMVIVAREEAPSGLAVTIRVGHRYPLTWGAHGKAVVAFSPPARRQQLLQARSPLFYEAAAMPSDEAIAAELDQARERGFAADVGGMQPGVTAVSAPLLNTRRLPAAALILVGTFPETMVPEHGRAVAAAAHDMNNELALFLDEGLRGRLQSDGPALPLAQAGGAEHSPQEELR